MKYVPLTYFTNNFRGIFYAVAQYSVLQEGSTELFFYSFLVLKFNEHVTYIFFRFPCADEVFESIKILMPNLYRSLYWCLR